MHVPAPLRRLETLVRFERPWVLGLVAAAVLLRLWHLGHGLPDFLDEAIPLRAALAMRDAASGAIDWNPHRFDAPSLTIYLHFAVQQALYGLGLVFRAWDSWPDYLMRFQLDPTAMVIAARLVGVVCDAFAVLAAFRLGRRFGYGAGLVAALLLAFAPTPIALARAIFPDSVMTCLALWALDTMLAWSERGGGRRLRLAALLVGLAAGARYPAAVLVGPLVTLAWRGSDAERPGPRGARVLAVCALALGAFLVTTPFAVLDPAAFLRDLRVEGGHAAQGYLGTERPDVGFHLVQLVRNLGGFSLVLLAGSAGFLLVRAQRVPAAVTWLALLGFGVPIAFAGYDAERDVLPVIALGAVLAAGALRAAVSPFRPSVRRVLLVVAVLAAAGPAIGAGLRAAWVGSDTTALAARRWCERSLRPEDVLVHEGYGARLPSETLVEETQQTPEFQGASAAIQEQVRHLRTFRVVAIPLASAGRIGSDVVGPRGRRELTVFEHAAELNAVFYDPRLYTGIDYLMTNDAVRGRFEADPRHYATQCAFYRLLDATSDVAARFDPHGPVEGPAIVIYRIGSRFRSAISMRGPLDALWWTRAVPDAYRGLAMQTLAPPPAPRTPRAAAGSEPGAILAAAASPSPAAFEPPRAAAVRDSAPAAAAAGADTLGEAPEPWVRTLAPVFDERVRRFAREMALSLARSRRYDEAAPFARAILLIHPEDEEACVVFSLCSRMTGADADARVVLERALAAPRVRPVDPALRLEYARVLADLGETARARQELLALAAIREPGDAVAAAARRMLAEGR